MKNSLAILIKGALVIYILFILGCDTRNFEQAKSENNIISKDLLNFIRAEVNDTIVTSGHKEKYELFTFSPLDSISIHSLNTKIYYFSQSQLSFFVLFNYKKKNYQIVTSTNCLQNNSKKFDIYSGINETDIKGIENYLDINYRNLDTSKTFLSAIDTLFRTYLNNCSDIKYLNNWKKIENLTLLDSVLNSRMSTYNWLNSDKNDVYFEKKKSLLQLFLKEKIFDKFCYIYFDRDFLEIFTIYYRGYNTCSFDWALKEDYIRNFKYNYRINRIII